MNVALTRAPQQGIQQPIMPSVATSGAFNAGVAENSVGGAAACSSPAQSVSPDDAKRRIRELRAYQASDGLRALCLHIGRRVSDVNTLDIGSVVVVAPEVRGKNRDKRISHSYILIVTQKTPEMLFDVFELDNIQLLYQKTPEIHFSEREHTEAHSDNNLRELIKKNKRESRECTYPFPLTKGVYLRPGRHGYPGMEFTTSRGVTLSFLNGQGTKNTALETRIQDGCVFQIPNIAAAHITTAFSVVQKKLSFGQDSRIRLGIVDQPIAYNCSNAVFDIVAIAAGLSGIKCREDILNGIPQQQAALNSQEGLALVARLAIYNNAQVKPANGSTGQRLLAYANKCMTQLHQPNMINKINSLLDEIDRLQLRSSQSKL